MREFVQKGYELTELPYTMEEIETKIELLDFDWQNFNQEDDLEKLEDGKSHLEVIITCPKCGHKFKS